MPNYNKLALGRKASELGFARDAFEKMSRLTVILQYIHSNEDLTACLALKGGTAINLTFFNLPRLSVDIDFDFDTNLSKEKTSEKREHIRGVIERYMANEGYALKDKSKKTHALDSFVYGYTNAAGNSDNIKIEINYILRSHILSSAEVMTRTDDVFPNFAVRTLAPAEISASKIVALTQRGAARDLYDLNNIVLSGMFKDKELSLLRKCAVFYLALTGDGGSQGLDLTNMNKITENKVHTDLRQMIRQSERFNLQAAKDCVSKFLLDEFALKDNENEFLKRFKVGNYKPQLLFDDAEIIKRIESHPMAMWRLRNIRDRQER